MRWTLRWTMARAAETAVRAALAQLVMVDPTQGEDVVRSSALQDLPRLINRFEKKSENLCAANRELHERIQVLEARGVCCTCRGGAAVKVEVARRHGAARPFLRAQVTAKHLVPSVVRSSVRDKLSRDAAEHTADNDACAHDAARGNASKAAR